MFVCNQCQLAEGYRFFGTSRIVFRAKTKTQYVHETPPYKAHDGNFAANSYTKIHPSIGPFSSTRSCLRPRPRPAAEHSGCAPKARGVSAGQRPWPRPGRLAGKRPADGRLPGCSRLGFLSAASKAHRGLAKSLSTLANPPPPTSPHAMGLFASAQEASTSCASAASSAASSASGKEPLQRPSRR